MNAKLPLLVGSLSVFASPIFAQAPSPSTPAANYHWVAITAGFSMAIASAGCGLAQAKATAAAAEVWDATRVHPLPSASPCCWASC